jgi:hypothetical protein
MKAQGPLRLTATGGLDVEEGANDSDKETEIRII